MELMEEGKRKGNDRASTTSQYIISVKAEYIRICMESLLKNGRWKGGGKGEQWKAVELAYSQQGHTEKPFEHLP
jgi:hypothetical protein